MNVTTKSDAMETPSSEESDSAEKQESLASFGLFLVKLLLAVLIFRSFIFSPFSIPSESMLPRLWNGDYLLASKWSYGFSKYSLPGSAPLIPGRILASQPDRGDLVIFKHPIDQKDYIKRAIALPGDTIGVVGGQIVLNGELISREPIAEFDIPVSTNTPCAWGADSIDNAQGVPVCRYRQFRETLPEGRSYNVLDFGLTQADSFSEVTVPEGRMFVMGDNRDNSQDSRFRAIAGGGVGMVPQELLVGKASIVMWSTDGSAEWIKPWTWFTAARWNRIGETL
ncbi:MAG: signal peptidase I [Pseudomonadota bacterium]